MKRTFSEIFNKNLDKLRIKIIISKKFLSKILEPTLKPKFLVAIVFFLSIILCHKTNGEPTRMNFIKLMERTYDEQLFKIYRGNSVDYRSFILIGFTDSLMNDQIRIKMEIKLTRKNGGRFEIPVPSYSYVTDSGSIAYNYRDYDPNSNVPLKETCIDLQKWAIEPGDELHFRIYDDINYSYIFERYIQIKRHGLGGNISFPILSVQRRGDHPGGLGAGISYTIRYTQPEKRLSNKLGFGLNFSFLDFDPSQKIEMGLGFAITFPDDLFQIGVGKNLTVKKDSGYYFLGINLPGIKEKIGL